MAVVIAWLAAAPLVWAQDGVPEGTITTVTLSSGHVLMIERVWTFGDLFVGVAVLLLICITALRFLYDVSQQWLS